MRQPARAGKDDEVVPWLESIDNEAEEQRDPGQQDTHDCYRPALAKGQIIRISAGMLGLMFGWAMKTVLTTPLFRDVYGVETADLGYIWLAGPLSGLIIQPVIGVISDHREREGQRSYFFALGAVFMAISLVVLPSAGNITRALTGEREGSSSDQEEGIGLAIAAFWVLDLAMNASLVAIRAIIADCAPPEQQPEANTAIIISYGVGTFLGYGFGAFNAARSLGLPSGPLGKACVDFGTAALVLLVTAAIACWEAFLLERSHAFSRSSHVSPSGRTNEYTHAEATSDVIGTHRCLEEAQTAGDPPRNSSIESHYRPLPKDSCTTENGEQQVFAQMSHGYRRIDGAAEPRAATTGGSTGGTAGPGDNGGSTRAGDEGDALERTGLDVSAAWREVSEGDQRGARRAGDDGGMEEETREDWALNWRGGTGEKDTEMRGSDELAALSGESTGGSGELNPHVKGNLSEMLLFYDVPDWLKPVCYLLFFSWVGWFAVIVFGSDWVAVDIFGGDPSSPDDDRRHQAYEDGVAWASMGLAAQAMVVSCMGCGPVTWLVQMAGIKGSFLTAVLFQSTLMLFAVFVREGPWGKTLSLVVLAGLGVPLALMESLPYMMVGMFSPRETHGQLLGKLNVWIVLAQLMLTLCINLIVGHVEDGDASVLTAGVIASAIALFFVPSIDQQGKKASESISGRSSAADDVGTCIGDYESRMAGGSPGSPNRALLR